MGRLVVGTVWDVIGPAVSVELIFLFHGLSDREKRQSSLLRRQVGPLGTCPICQMTSPALLLRTTFMEEDRVKKSRQSYDRSRPQILRSHREDTRSLNNWGYQGPLITEVHCCKLQWVAAGCFPRALCTNLLCVHAVQFFWEVNLTAQ